MRRALAGLLLLYVGCAPGPAPVVRAPSPTQPGRVDYEVRVDATGDELEIAATLPPGTQQIAIAEGSEPFVLDLVDEAGRALRRDGDHWPVSCARGCAVKYRFALRKAGDALDDPDAITSERTIVEGPPSAWLIHPVDAPGSTRCALHVVATGRARFVTGLYRAARPDTWEFSLDDFFMSPYSAFGALRSRFLRVAGSTIEVAIAQGQLAVDDDTIAAWVESEAKAVAAFYGRFPTPSAAVIVVPGRARWIGLGKTLAGGGASIYIRVGERATKHELDVDWVLAHEMTHLAFPTVPRNQAWIEEGLATYVEPIARTRAGLTDDAETWGGFVDGMPNGLPRDGDRGLDRTPTWGRVYWGGALFCLVADVEIRKATNNAKSLDDALRAILAEGGDNAHRWRLSRAFEVGDAATGTHVLRDLYGKWSEEPVMVDLRALFRELGVAVRDKRVVFDDAAPLASMRKSMTARATPGAAGSALRTGAQSR